MLVSEERPQERGRGGVGRGGPCVCVGWKLKVVCGLIMCRKLALSPGASQIFGVENSQEWAWGQEWGDRVPLALGCITYKVVG